MENINKLLEKYKNIKTSEKDNVIQTKVEISASEKTEQNQDYFSIVKKNIERYKNKENEKFLSKILHLLKNYNNIIIVGPSRIGKTTLIKNIFCNKGTRRQDCFYIEEGDLLMTGGEIREVARGNKFEDIKYYPYEMALKTNLLILDDIFLNTYLIEKNIHIYKKLLDYRIENNKKTIFISNEVSLLTEYNIEDNIKQGKNINFRLIGRMLDKGIIIHLKNWQVKIGKDNKEVYIVTL